MIGSEGGLGGNIFLGLLAPYLRVMNLQTNVMEKKAKTVKNQRDSSMTKVIIG